MIAPLYTGCHKFVITLSKVCHARLVFSTWGASTGAPHRCETPAESRLKGLGGSYSFARKGPCRLICVAAKAQLFEQHLIEGIVNLDDAECTRFRTSHIELRFVLSQLAALGCFDFAHKLITSDHILGSNDLNNKGFAMVSKSSFQVTRHGFLKRILNLNTGSANQFAILIQCKQAKRKNLAFQWMVSSRMPLQQINPDQGALTAGYCVAEATEHLLKPN